MRWLDRLDAWGRSSDTKWTAWLNRRIAPTVIGGVSAGIELGLPLLGAVAILYLLFF